MTDEDLEAVDFIAERCYDTWRHHFDLAATWSDLNQERRDGWRAVATMRVRAEAAATILRAPEEASQIT